MVASAQRAGARGFVVKSHLSADLLPALEAALLHSSRISVPVSKAWHEAMASSKQSARHAISDPGPHDDLDLMSGGGEMGALMRSMDWSKTPFGPVSEWPQSLRTALRICLDSKFPILIWWGPELRILYNDAWKPALGTTKQREALGAPGQQVWSEVWDTIGPMLEGVMRTGQATWENDQLLLFDRHGYVEESYWTYSYSAIRLSSGEVGGVFSAVHEVTDRVLNARRLKTLREVADQVVQAKHVADACALAMQSIARNPADCPYAMIFLCDGEKATRVALSFDAARLIPSMLDLSQDDSWAIQRAVQNRAAQVYTVSNPEQMPAAPFGDRCKKAISLPILGTSREPMAVLTIGISPYRALDESYQEFFDSLAKNLAANINNARAYDEERKRAEALAELDRAKTVFFSNVSHEFRTPLTLMLGPMEDSLAASNDLPAEHRQRLEVAHRNSVRLLKLVNTLLDFSRIEAGRIEASYEPTDLARLTTDLASMFRSATERAGLRLIINCPHIAESVYVDLEMWEKIVFNLLSNAFKFTLAGEIEVSLHKVDGSVELSVRDTGNGIPEQDLPHLFKRFYRVKGALGRTFEGSGIGLSLVLELAKLHGGTVRVASRPNQGSTFTVSVPLGKDHLPADRIGAPRTLASTGLRGEAYVQEALRWLPGGESNADNVAVADLLSSSDASPQVTGPARTHPRILLADDNADMREYVRRLLRGHYEVEAVADGESALQRAREYWPDLILSDIMMPRLDGFGLLQALRADESLRSIPVLLLSARAGEESRIEGLQSGADDYLVKPFSARELLARVRSHLATAQVRREAVELRHKLRYEGELLAAIVSNSDDAIVSKNLDGTITSWNKGAERMFGYTAEEAIGRHITLIVPDDRLEEETKILQRLRRGERVDHFTTIRRRKDGKRLDVSLTISPVKDSAGRIIGASKVARDITAQKQAEQALRESEERFRAIVETTPECVKLVAPDGTLLHMNSPGFQMVGASSADQVVGKSLFDLIAPEHREKFRAFNQKVCAGEKGSLEFDIVGLKGKRRHMETHAAPLRDLDGRTVHLAITRDVSERKQAEERERQMAEEALAATAKFRAVFEQTTVFAGIMTLDGVLIDANKLCLEACGYRPEQVLGRPFWETPWWKNFQESRDKIRAATPLAAQGTPYRETINYSWADGTQRLVDFALYPILDNDGRVLFLHPTGVDITDLKRVEENYRKLAETLEAEVRARTAELETRNLEVLRQSELLRGFSQRLMRAQDEERRHIARELHDSAGQTLTVLGMNLAQLIQKAGRSAPELASLAEMIQESVQQLHREIRTTSYLLHPPLLDESGLSSSLSWYLQGIAERSGLEIHLDIPDGFGRLPRDMELLVFRVVQECLTNIHRHSGSKTANIRIAREADAITVDVQDQGHGMSPERLADIQTRGSGVGIRGMSERLRQFDASLKIESDGSGTRISATIPIPKAELSEEQGGVESLRATG